MKRFGIKRFNETWLNCFYNANAYAYCGWSFDINTVYMCYAKLTYVYGPNQFTVEEYNE